MKKNLNIYWFSIIEVMIAIFIFAMGMASIFMVISSSMSVDNLNKNQIIASNLAREEIELIRNIRDSNYTTYHKWNWIPNFWNNYWTDNFFSTWFYYKIENDFSSSDFPFKINKISNFWEWVSELNWKMQNYKLYLDWDNYYNYDNTWTGTIFYRYLYLEELKDWSWVVILDAIKVKSKVIWYSKWYHEFEINTILADFNRL